MNPFVSPESAIAWAETETWCQAMALCPQDKNYHAEGDVWTHTKMVVRQLVEHPAWAETPQEFKESLIAAGTLHDCGKPATTVEEAGSIKSRGHSYVGARIARKVLRNIGLPLKQREEIVNLILCHGWPPRIVERASPEMEVIRAGWLCRNDHLCLLSWADALGRQGKDTGFLDSIAIWESLAKEYDCWAQPFPKANDEARVLAFEGKDIRFYTPREDYRAHMVIMSGLPGAGKDTWIQRNHANLPIVSLDSLRTAMDISPTDKQGAVVTAAREAVRQNLRRGNHFILNATCVTRDNRARWLRLAREYCAHIQIVYLEPPLATILSQNQRRKHPVPERVIHALVDKLDVPQVSEAHNLQLYG
jgi:predicted kinase